MPRSKSGIRPGGTCGARLLNTPPSAAVHSVSQREPPLDPALASSWVMHPSSMLSAVGSRLSSSPSPVALYAHSHKATIPPRTTHGRVGPCSIIASRTTATPPSAPKAHNAASTSRPVPWQQTSARTWMAPSARSAFAAGTQPSDKELRRKDTARRNSSPSWPMASAARSALMRSREPPRSMKSTPRRGSHFTIASSAATQAHWPSALVDSWPIASMSTANTLADSAFGCEPMSFRSSFTSSKTTQATATRTETWSAVLLARERQSKSASPRRPSK